MGKVPPTRSGGSGGGGGGVSSAAAANLLTPPLVPPRFSVSPSSPLHSSAPSPASVPLSPPLDSQPMFAFSTETSAERAKRDRAADTRPPTPNQNSAEYATSVCRWCRPPRAAAAPGRAGGPAVEGIGRCVHRRRWRRGLTAVSRRVSRGVLTVCGIHRFAVRPVLATTLCVQTGQTGEDSCS